MGKEFSTADKGKTFKRGGDMATKMDPKMMAMMAAKKRGAGKGAMAPARPAMPPAAPAGGMGMMKKGGMTKMAAGGMPMKDGKPAFIGDGKGAMKKGGLTAGHKAADGVASKGKTKGMMVKMKSGGKAC